MANYNESLEAVDSHIHSVRYDMELEWGGWLWSQIGPHQVTYKAVAWSKQMQRALAVVIYFHTIITNYNGPLEHTDCYIFAVLNTMVVE